jgi:integrase/recombinase XerC
MEFLYATACRVGELVQVRVEDLNWQDRTVLLHGKGRKDRMGLFGGEAAKALKVYLRSRRTGPLFTSKRFPDKPLTVRSIARLIGAASIRAGLKPVNPHAFRHSCASHLLNRGMSLRYIQELLGHSSLSMTQVYTHVALDQLKRCVENFHPREAFHANKKQSES